MNDDQRVLRHEFDVFIFMPLFGDTCRDEGTFAAHVLTWSKFSWWLSNVGAFLFGAAAVAIQSGLRVEDIWDSAIRFDLSP